MAFTIFYKGTPITTVKFMKEVPPFVVQDYCKRFPATTLADLQRIFAGVKNHSGSYMNIIETPSAIDAYYSTHSSKTPRFSGPYTLPNGDVIMVSDQWADNGPKANFNAFVNKANILGYQII